jgi:hypothetical protein
MKVNKAGSIHAGISKAETRARVARGFIPLALGTGVTMRRDRKAGCAGPQQLRWERRFTWPQRKSGRLFAAGIVFYGEGAIMQRAPSVGRLLEARCRLRLANQTPNARRSLNQQTLRQFRKETLRETGRVALQILKVRPIKVRIRPFCRGERGRGRQRDAEKTSIMATRTRYRRGGSVSPGSISPRKSRRPCPTSHR